MRRRAFIKGLGGVAAAWPFAASAQQSNPKTIGFLRDAPLQGSEYLVESFRKGLAEGGLTEDADFVIELGMSEGRRDRLQSTAADFARRPVALIAASATSAVMAAKAATSSVPIVVAFPGDPVQLGLAQSMNRPGGNLTGVSYLNTELVAKRIGILRDLVPDLPALAVLINPVGANADETTKEVNRAIGTALRGTRVHFLRASTAAGIDVAFKELWRQGVKTLLVGNDAFFTTQRERLVRYAADAGIVAMYSQREFAEAGGLLAYGASLPEAYRLAGLYGARILKGEKPADLPIVNPTKFEFLVNLKAAKALNVQIPDRILALADEVIE
jgi:putative tryptophan/tyrosine transport system substrate-binding protein